MNKVGSPTLTFKTSYALAFAGARSPLVQSERPHLSPDYRYRSPPLHSEIVRAVRLQARSPRHRYLTAAPRRSVLLATGFPPVGLDISPPDRHQSPLACAILGTSHQLDRRGRHWRIRDTSRIDAPSLPLFASLSQVRRRHQRSALVRPIH
jgi:hypothetical protein